MQHLRNWLFLSFFSGGKGDKGQPSKQESSCDVDKSSAPVLLGSNTDATNANTQPAPIPRTPSLSKPTPKPRPRSLVSEKDPEKDNKVEETAVKPVAPPRTKAKSSKGNGEADAESDQSAIKAPKPEPPARPDLNPPPPVKPKPKPVRNEPVAEQGGVSPVVSDSESIEVTNMSSGDVSSNVQDFRASTQGKDSSEEPPLKGKAEKARPPPIPRRVDLD